MNTAVRVLGLTALVVAIAGCSHGEKPAALAPQFSIGAGASPLRTQKPMAADPLSGVDQPGALEGNGRAHAPDADLPNATGVQPLSRTVTENVTAPGEVRRDQLPPTAEALSTRPAPAAPTTGIGASSGQYLTIGGVVSEVNGTPIYANKVLALAEPALAAGAKQYDPQQFRQYAARELRLMVEDLEFRQLEYAAAERNLDQKEKDLAENLTMNWKQQQIREAGGSLERAKQAAAARGEDFDDLAQEQYRKYMAQIYYQKKRFPRIQVSAADMRAYYDKNREREFTDRGVAQFRLIKIDARKHDGRENAQRLANELHNRIARAGESFEAIARSVNDDPRLLRSGGDVGKIEQNSFAVERVDQAVWNTPQGQITPVIDTGDAFYIAQVLEKKPGKILPFEDETVQQRISDRLYAEQFRSLREDEKRKLLGDAIVRSDPVMMNTALEMAMQNYPRWAGAGK